MPVGEHCVAGPHGSNVLRTIGIIQEHATVVAVSVDAVVVAGIIRIGDVNGRINNAELILVLCLLRGCLLITYGM